MTLDEFLQKTRVELPENVLRAAQDGLDKMSLGLDPLHNHKHPQRMLSDLKQMMETVTEVNWSKVNFPILLLAIIWHDVWKSRKRNSNKRKIIFNHLAEGVGSMRVFSKETSKHNLDKQLVKKIRYAIRKHSMLQILPKWTVEAKILKTLDELEDWSVERFTDSLTTIKNLNLDFNPKILPLFRLYVDFWLTRKKGVKYFAWTRVEYRNRQQNFLKNTWPLIRNTLKNSYFSSKISKFKV